MSKLGIKVLLSSVSWPIDSHVSTSCFLFWYWSATPAPLSLYTLNPTRENNDNSQDCDFDTKLIRRNKIKLESDESVLDLNFCYYAKEKDEKDPFEFLNKITWYFN